MTTTKMMELDKMIKIEGTMHDNRRKMSASMIARAKEMRAAGMKFNKIAGALGVSNYTVKYYTDPAFAESEKIRLRISNKKHYYDHREEANKNQMQALRERVERKVQIVKDLIEE